MAFRTFTDRDGLEWEIRPAARGEWEFSPIRSNPGPRRIVNAPGYEKDPYELSRDELQRLIDSSTSPRKRDVKSPFND
jgi:hypothetical protein